ncbi:MAG: adenylyltransferase/cytidyltransferase family protein [Planctomycetia bacterium]|nr:MAG: adenylyltransferase/cytidyltransferase family protein [Planctomycetia bacterium]
MTPSPQRKILDPAAIARQAAALRAAGRTIVHCHGCFDIVHPGHIRYLQFARQLADVLVVSLTGDDRIQKGPDRPYIPQELRAENLAVLEFVDYVVIDPHPTACELLEALRPDVYVKGREYAGSSDPRFEREREIVERHGGRVIFHSGDVVFSSTGLLRSLARDQQLDEHRLRALCNRHGIDTASTRGALDAFTDLRVVVIGDLIRERYVICDAVGTADDGPALSLRRLGEQSYWCAAGATALQLAALGARPTLISVVGSDPESRTLEAQFAERGVSSVLLPERPDIASRSTFVADDTRLFKLSDSPAHPLDSSAERRVAAALRSRLAGAGLVIWCDHGYGAVTPGLVRSLRDHLPAENGPKVVGAAVGPQADLLGLAGADALVVSERQARETAHDMGSGLPAVAWKLLHTLGTGALLISLRKRGLMSFRPGVTSDPAAADRLRSDFIPSLAVFHIDPLGSDETILATAALTLATGGSLPLAGYLAACGEAIAVSRAGGRHVQAAELADWLGQRPELRPESRFQPDSATPADLARIAPPLPMPS